jgi:hypothetical protein
MVNKVSPKMSPNSSQRCSHINKLAIHNLLKLGTSPFSPKKKNVLVGTFKSLASADSATRA